MRWFSRLFLQTISHSLNKFLKSLDEVLTVTRRGILKPDFPNPPQNHIWFQNKPVEKCDVKPGEWFVIGQTRPFQGQTWRFPFHSAVALNSGSSSGDEGTG